MDVAAETRRRVAALALCMTLALPLGCFRPGEDAARLDEEVGQVEVAGVSAAIGERLGAFRVAEPGRLVVWAQAPTLGLELRAAPEATITEWTVELHNILPEAELSALDAATGQPVAATRVERPLPTRGVWQVSLAPGQTLALEVAAPDARTVAPLRFAFVNDIHADYERVGDLFARINRDPTLRFVLSNGDMTDLGERSEHEGFLRALEGLAVPYYSVPGTHEIGEPELWAELYGPSSFSWSFAGARFTSVDSGGGTLDPRVYERLETWLALGRAQYHVFNTHVPPLDPYGTRNGSFRSRDEAGKLLAMLAGGRVDLTLYGHLHSYYAFENADIPAYISAGGGPRLATFDGIGRHYLAVTIDPVAGTHEVAVVRID